MYSPKEHQRPKEGFIQGEGHQGIKRSWRGTEWATVTPFLVQRDLSQDATGMQRCRLQTPQLHIPWDQGSACRGPFKRCLHQRVHLTHKLNRGDLNPEARLSHLKQIKSEPVPGQPCTLLSSRVALVGGSGRL